MKKEYVEALQQRAKEAYAKTLPILKQALSIIASVDWKKYMSMAAGVAATVARALWGHWTKASWKRQTVYAAVLLVCGYLYIDNRNHEAKAAKQQAEAAAEKAKETDCLKNPACVATTSAMAALETLRPQMQADAKKEVDLLCRADRMIKSASSDLTKDLDKRREASWLFFQYDNLKNENEEKYSKTPEMKSRYSRIWVQTKGKNADCE